MYKPELVCKFLKLEKNSFGIHELIHNCILKCDHEIRKDFYSGIVLSGGNTMFSGFTERLNRELT